MVSQIEQNLTSNQKRELQRLRRTRSRRILRLVLFFLLCIFAFYVIKRNFAAIDPQRLNIVDARETLLQSRLDWAQKLADNQASLYDWLDRRGTGYEKLIYNKISVFAFYSANRTIKEAEELRLGVLDTFTLWLHQAFLRISFMLIACSRLWLIVLAYAAYRGTQSWRVYKAPDILGETGNNRLFYSGIRAGLDDISPSGAPEKQVRGLACPRHASEARLRSSGLHAVLNRYQVANKTNLELAAIIVEYGALPAYVTVAEEEELLKQTVELPNLHDNTCLLLERILDLHGHYINSQGDKGFEAFLKSAGQEQGSISAEAYSKQLQRCLHRVLTEDFKEELSRLGGQHIATLVLALEAGKVLSYSKDSDRWFRRSNYPQLCARSVLHSTEGFAKEYNYDQRSVIRQALIYAERTSHFGHVKLPVDLAEVTRAMRQWSEVLLACPHELKETADEVELYGIIYQTHKNWSRAFFDAFMLADKKFLDGLYCTQANLLLIPFAKLYRQLRQAVAVRDLKRLEELTFTVSQNQRIKSICSDPGLETMDKGAATSGKVFQPIADGDVQSLSKMFRLPEQAVREWSALRIVLNNFGWLARRVGDYSVSEPSLIFAVLQPSPGDRGKAGGLIGQPAMVPLRTTQLEARWGKSWQSRVQQVFSATMAESLEDYNKLMRGEELHALEEVSLVNAS